MGACNQVCVCTAVGLLRAFSRSQGHCVMQGSLHEVEYRRNILTNGSQNRGNNRGKHEENTSQECRTRQESVGEKISEMKISDRVKVVRNRRTQGGNPKIKSTWCNEVCDEAEWKLSMGFTVGNRKVFDTHTQAI